MTRDFLGVALFAFIVAINLIFRFSTVGNTPLPIPQPTSDNAGSMLVTLLLVMAVLVILYVCFTIWMAVIVLRVVFGGWRDLSRERFVLASVTALAWSSYANAQPVRVDGAASTWLANVPAIIMPALFVWGVVTNTVILYWLTGAIHRLWAGDRSI